MGAGLSDDELRDLARRATFLRERLAALPPTGVGDVGDPSVLVRWRRAVAPEGSDWFEKRLDWDGLSPSELPSLDPRVEATPEDDEPGWLAVLTEVSEAARRLHHGGVATHDLLKPDSPIPFEELLLPVVDVARARLEWRLVPGVLLRSALEDLERSLLEALSRLAGQVLYAELERTRGVGESLLAGLGLGTPAEGTYAAFVSRHLETGWTAIFRDYPVLARLIALSVAQWVETTAELGARLDADREDLCEAFGMALPLPSVVRIEPLLGDRHQGGRSVTAVTFSDGSRLVYKPKSLAMDVAFNGLVEWCNARHGSVALETMRVVDRGTYGWTEFAVHEPCANEDSARLFYRRAGMLLCLLYLTQATDCHFENLVAHGEHPVLVDTETILYPDPVPLEDRGESGDGGAAEVLTGSVLRTGFLPNWEVDEGASAPAYDRSALGSGARVVVRSGFRWDHVNSDAMHLTLASEELATSNMPSLGDRELSASDYQSELVGGFESTYRLLLKHRDELGAESGPLAAMRGGPVRFVARPTRVYSALLAECWAPEALRDGVEFGICTEQLARAYLVARERPVAWPMLAAEVRALEQMDVPLFVTRTDSRDLVLVDQTTISGAFVEPSHDQARERLEAMSEADLREQVRLITASLVAKRAHGLGGVPRGSRSAIEEPAAQLADDELLRAAARIGDEIAESALRAGPEVGWIATRYLHEHGRFQIGLLDDSLYDGASGTALFLAALSRASGDDGFARLAVQSLHRLRRAVREVERGSEQFVARMHGIGSATGIGSWIYGLVHTERLLDGPVTAALVEDAVALSGWLTPDVIAADERLDVIDGSAGALLALLELHAVTGEPHQLERAVRCGDRLLERAVERNGYRVWPTTADEPLAGFGHGCAGIAYALVRLYAATDDRAYLDAAREGIAFERSVFSTEHGSWPDLRPPGSADPSGFPVRWCHGASGIALGRLGCARHLDADPLLDGEIRVGLDAVEASLLQDVDHLCCGNAGLVEALLVAAERDGGWRWRELAGRTMAGVLDRTRRDGGFVVASVPGFYHPGLFQGTAGIGYEMLRLVDPSLPSVLLFAGAS